MRRFFRATGVMLAPLVMVACVPRARMCGAPSECGTSGACVAGRCQPPEATLAISEAQVRRVVAMPIDVAYVRPSMNAGDALPLVFTLGRAEDAGALVLLRFSVPLARDVKILEAYVMLERSDALDADPTPITLHAARIASAWDPRSLTWGRTPRLEETHAPSTTIRASGPSLVRVDVGAIVRRWLEHERRDQGIAIVADTTSVSGMPFAFSATHENARPSIEPANPTSEGAIEAETIAAPGVSSPRLELYIR